MKPSYESEDSFPTAGAPAAPKGLLSDLEGEEAEGEGDLDIDATHAETALEAIKANDAGGFMDAIKAIVRSCIKKQGSGSYE